MIKLFFPGSSISVWPSIAYHRKLLLIPQLDKSARKLTKSSFSVCTEITYNHSVAPIRVSLINFYVTDTEKV